ncbi:MAG: M20/M25/M40 family metallo-hydrolase [Bacteroidetes bacterium]|nr:M20/M25/M40 family metallo-hydrolase [Bacteroidota bacterium]
MKNIITFLFIFCFIYASAQKGKADNKIINPIKKHILVLSNDSLEGRGTGTAAELKAAKYIKGVMEENGLKPYDQYPNFEQTFTFTSSKYSKSKFKLISSSAEISYKEKIDFWPLSISSSGRAFSGWFNAGFGIVAEDLKQNDYLRFTSLDSGKIFLIDIGNPDGINPHTHFAKYDLSYKVNEAIKHGASGVVFYQSNAKVDVPDSSLSVKISGYGIPVLYTNNTQISMQRIPRDAALYIETNIQKIEKTGHNVLGSLDYGKLYTIVIGAHYDHLGWGDQGGSLHAAHSKAIHNGADDNASGVAVMLELINQIKKDKNLHEYNYMFVAFSGEELGLYGSSNLVKHLPINPLRVNCMLNMDMVGRLDTTKKTLVVGGVGTSPLWDQLDSIKLNGLNITKTESGVGPSDHTSFYKENIPVLHFFTGMHSDYHKPTDDEHLINYNGTELVKKYILEVVSLVNKNDRMLFTKTKDSENTNMPKYKVSLGIMPDYTFDGKGVRVDGVSENKPAFKAGIKKGDIIIKLGDFDTSDMTGYTKALSNFAKGDSTSATIMRDGKEITISVTF